METVCYAGGRLKLSLSCSGFQWTLVQNAQCVLVEANESMEFSPLLRKELEATAEETLLMITQAM